METFSIMLTVIAKFCSLISQGKEEVSSTISTQMFSMNRLWERGNKEKGRKILSGKLKGENGFYESIRKLLTRKWLTTHSYILHILGIECLYTDTLRHKPNQLWIKRFLAAFATYFPCITKVSPQTLPLNSARRAQGTQKAEQFWHYCTGEVAPIPLAWAWLCLSPCQGQQKETCSGKGGPGTTRELLPYPWLTTEKIPPLGRRNAKPFVLKEVPLHHSSQGLF